MIGFEINTSKFHPETCCENVQRSVKGDGGSFDNTSQSVSALMCQISPAAPVTTRHRADSPDDMLTCQKVPETDPGGGRQAFFFFESEGG